MLKYKTYLKREVRLKRNVCFLYAVIDIIEIKIKFIVKLLTV